MVDHQQIKITIQRKSPDFEDFRYLTVNKTSFFLWSKVISTIIEVSIPFMVQNHSGIAKSPFSFSINALHVSVVFSMTICSVIDKQLFGTTFQVSEILYRFLSVEDDLMSFHCCLI